MWDKQCSHVEVKQINICESVSTKGTAFESAEASYVNGDAQNFKKSVTQELFAAKALVTAKPSEKNLNEGASSLARQAQRREALNGSCPLPGPFNSFKIHQIC